MPSTTTKVFGAKSCVKLESGQADVEVGSGPSLQALNVGQTLADNDVFVREIMTVDRPQAEEARSLHVAFAQWKLDRTIRLNRGAGSSEANVPKWLIGLTVSSPRSELLQAASFSTGLSEKLLNLVLKGEEEFETEFLFNLATQVVSSDERLDTTVEVSPRALHGDSVSMEYPQAGVPPTRHRRSSGRK